MPGRSTQQNLRNFEAISLRLEPLAVVNAKLLFGNINMGGTDTLRSFVNGGFGSFSEVGPPQLGSSGLPSGADKFRAG